MCTAFRQIREEGISQGIKLGKDQGIKLGQDQGIKIGEERVNLLIQRLIKDCRMEEIERAVSDRAYQQELFTKYGI